MLNEIYVRSILLELAHGHYFTKESPKDVDFQRVNRIFSIFKLEVTNSKSLDNEKFSDESFLNNPVDEGVLQGILGRKSLGVVNAEEALEEGYGLLCDQAIGRNRPRLTSGT